MKKLVTLVLLITSFMNVNAQTTYDNFRKVSTKGYAEKEITPDIIYLSINLKEFYLNGNLKKKVFIETLEKQLFDAAMSIGVQKEDFTIQNIYSYNYNNSKKNTELLQSRQYRIKVTNLNRLNEMMQQIDPNALQSTAINGYDHSNKKEIEKQLKSIAVKDARANAEILAEADGQSIGKAILISDNSNFNFNDLIYTAQPRLMKANLASDASESAVNDLDINIRPIKFTCNIDAVFELK